MSAEQPQGPAAYPAGGRSPYLAVTACFFLSGFAALLYQTAWLREFSLVFGTSELAVATVLAAYMAGLAAGAAVVGRYLGRVRRPVLVYGLLEAGIAVSALAVPVLLVVARSAYAWLLGAQATPPDAAATGQAAFYLGVGFVVLALPTSFMGATLPLLTRYAVGTDRQVGPRVALLYGINTAGAVAGTLVAGFWLLPALGLRGTVWFGVAVNVLVFALAALVSRALPEVAVDEPARPAASGATPAFWRDCIGTLLRSGETASRRLEIAFREQPAWVLPLMLASGAISFLYEVLWTRMLAHVIGSSIYAFATMLAAFLAGIALGGGAAGWLARRRDRAALVFAATELSIGALSAGIYHWMGALLPDAQTTTALTLYSILVMLPATVFIGATFPLAVRIVTPDEHEAGAATAKIYAWNTAGAIIGAVLGGFVLIPALGFEGAIKLAVLGNLLLALWALLFVARPRPAFAWPVAAAALAALVLYAPTRPEAVVARTGFIPEALDSPTELYYAVGRSSTVMLLEEGGHYYLRTNGLPEASVVAKGGIANDDGTRWLGAMPVLVRPDTASLLMIGFGGGVALEGIPESVRTIDAVEIEPEVINANRVLSGKRDTDPLTDPRVHIVINDARNALRLTDKTYDAIVSQPSHPWTAGASHLFTREFLAESKRHLNPDGVFVQWMNAEFVDEALLKSLAATLRAEFKNVRLYEPASRFLLFVASDGKLDPELGVARNGRPLTADVMHYSRLGINGAEDLVAALALDEDGLARFADDAPPSTDDDNLMATESRAQADGLRPSEIDRLLAPFDPLADGASWIYRSLGADLDFGYIADRLIRAGQLARARSMASALRDKSEQALIQALVEEASGDGREAVKSFLAALDADPRNVQARYQLLERLRLNAGDLESGAAGLSTGLSASAAAVLSGWDAQARGDWAALARLDDDLAKARVTDAWYPESARLRAEWRLHVARDRKKYAFDALRLIDRALLLAPERDLYLLRANSALILEDQNLIVESCSYVTESIRRATRAAEEQNASVPDHEREVMHANLEAVSRALEGPLVDHDASRTREVLRDTRELLTEL